MTISEKNATIPKYFTLILGIMAMLTPLAIDMYLPSFLAIAKELEVTPEKIQQTLVLYTFGFAIGQVFWGPIADSFGRKIPILIGTLIFALTALLLTQVNDIQHFLGLRFMQGVFGAAPAVILGALLRDLFDKNQLSKMMSMIMLVSMVAPLLAPFVGGYIAKFFHWHSIFYVLAFFGGLSCLLVAYMIPETHHKEKRIPLNLKSIVRNFVTLMRVRAVWGYLLCSAFSFSGVFVFLTSGSIVYIDLYGIAPHHFGYFFFLNMLVLIGFTLINSRFVVKFGAEKMLRLGLTIQGIAGVWLALVGILDLGFWPMVIGVAFFVGMLSIIGANAMSAILANYPHVAGTASSLIGSIRFGTGALVGFLMAFIPLHRPQPMLFGMFACIFIGLLCYYLFTYRSNKAH